MLTPIWFFFGCLALFMNIKMHNWQCNIHTIQILPIWTVVWILMSRVCHPLDYPISWPVAAQKLEVGQLLRWQSKLQQCNRTPCELEEKGEFDKSLTKKFHWKVALSENSNYLANKTCLPANKIPCDPDTQLIQKAQWEAESWSPCTQIME